MTEWICTDPDSFQWQRKAGRFSTEYEMYQVLPMPSYVEGGGWTAGGGTFRIEDYNNDEISYVLGLYGYRRNGIRNDLLAEILFECNWADFDLMEFDTEAEAVAYVNELMGR